MALIRRSRNFTGHRKSPRISSNESGGSNTKSINEIIVRQNLQVETNQGEFGISPCHEGFYTARSRDLTINEAIRLLPNFNGKNMLVTEFKKGCIVITV